MPRRLRHLSGDRLRVALVGCGAMGSRHARVVAADPDCELAAVVDTDPERATILAERHGTRVERTVPREVDAVVVATPTTTHARIAGPLLADGVWCLVEKPLAHSAEAARSLRHPRCAVGHVERHNPALRAAGSLAPRVVEARRIAPPTGRGTDVDVILDLMIHDIDLVLDWAGPGAEVAWIDAAAVAVAGDLVDTASVRLRTTTGLTATLLASRVASERQRHIACYEGGRSTVLDLLSGRARRGGQELHAADPRDALTCQWQAFTDAVRRDRRPEAGGDAGIRAVEVAERIRAVTLQEARCER
ncbi:MAG: Gfo/Idh/MocA family oxidoreductase [Alphaproteobacteria bacterium]|nr:Gfo/Idh/MocA family oxidoreductase [Alphaproteobacteria bacterium]MCB9699512.1 Gfo/Idh/MocA family oxidoreductase [Alphaproteobacteria bacterium]